MNISTSAPPDARIHFSQEQYEWLNKMYPEQVGNPDTTEATYRYNAGTRAVVYLVKSRVR